MTICHGTLQTHRFFSPGEPDTIYRLGTTPGTRNACLQTTLISLQTGRCSEYVERHSCEKVLEMPRASRTVMGAARLRLVSEAVWKILTVGKLAGLSHLATS